MPAFFDSFINQLVNTMITSIGVVGSLEMFRRFRRSLNFSGKTFWNGFIKVAKTDNYKLFTGNLGKDKKQQNLSTTKIAAYSMYVSKMK